MHSDDAHLIAHGQGRRARHLLIWGCVVLLATGIAWLLGHDVWLQRTPFGPQPLRHGHARTASGVLTVFALAVLLLSAIGLQYAPEAAHAWLSATHWVLGIALSVALPWHWIARLRH